MTRTAADICRERGWGEGTVVERPTARGSTDVATIKAVHVTHVVFDTSDGKEAVAVTGAEGWREHDPDAELVDAMAAVMPTARFDLYGKYELCPEAPLRDEHQVMARAALDLLRDRGECFHPDHQGDDWEPSNESVHHEATGAFVGHHHPQITSRVLAARERLIDQHRETEQP